jgi:transcription elongation factor GreA
MQCPTRKPGKYTHEKKDPYITLPKYKELKAQLEKLTKISRPRTIVEVKHHALDGDFSENAAYQIAKGRLRGINQRILDIESQLRNAVIIDSGKNSGLVSLGCNVTVRFSGREKTYLILGSAETDPTKGIISHNSPLGSVLIGRKAGEKITVKLAGKDIDYEIIKID